MCIYYPCLDLNRHSYSPCVVRATMLEPADLFSSLKFRALVSLPSPFSSVDSPKIIPFVLSPSRSNSSTRWPTVSSVSQIEEVTSRSSSYLQRHVFVHRLPAFASKGNVLPLESAYKCLFFISPFLVRYSSSVGLDVVLSSLAISFVLSRQLFCNQFLLISLCA